MTDIPPFRPENYPRTYKHAPEAAVYGFVTAGIAGFFGLFGLLVVAFKYHGDFDAGGVCAGFAVIGLILAPLGLIGALAPRLTLTADAIEYRGMYNFYWLQRMRRADIAGVRTVEIYGTGRYGSGTYGTAFMPKDVKKPYLFLPEWIFTLDDTYDAWVGGFPYLGGIYSNTSYGSPRLRLNAEDSHRVEWRNHKWKPRKE